MAVIWLCVVKGTKRRKEKIFASSLLVAAGLYGVVWSLVKLYHHLPN